MAGSRKDKVAGFIRNEVSKILLFELQDPRIGFVTVTGVDLSGDLHAATVKLSIMGDEREQAVALHAIKRARGFVQKELAGRLSTKFVPKISFEIDDAIKKSLQISKALRESKESEIKQSETEENESQDDETPNDETQENDR